MKFLLIPFFNFIDPTEARALKLCLLHNDSPEDMHDIIVSMFSVAQLSQLRAILEN